MDLVEPQCLRPGAAGLPREEVASAAQLLELLGLRGSAYPRSPGASRGDGESWAPAEAPALGGPGDL